jgi:mRNA interferase RelE/StbE
MSFQGKLTVSASNVAKKLNPEIKKVAKKALKELAKDPFLGKELQTELSGFWSYRFLRYRIIYKADIQKKIIIVWAIGHRRDVYETLSEHIQSLST